MIEALLGKIVLAVFKKAVVSPFLTAMATAVEIYTIFDALAETACCLETTSDCQPLDVYGVRVVSNVLSNSVVDRLLDIGDDEFEVSQTDGGVYVASRLIRRPFLLPSAEGLIYPTTPLPTETVECPGCGGSGQRVYRGEGFAGLFPGLSTCSTCSGKGNITVRSTTPARQLITCPSCDGAGERIYRREGFAGLFPGLATCDVCEGVGKVWS